MSLFYPAAVCSWKLQECWVCETSLFPSDWVESGQLVQKLLEQGKVRDQLQRDEEHKEAHCCINPGSKMRQFWCICGSLRPAEVVAVPEANQFLSFAHREAAKLQDCLWGTDHFLLHKACNLEMGLHCTERILEPRQSVTWVIYTWMHRLKGKKNYLAFKCRKIKAKTSDLLQNPEKESEEAQMSHLPI